MRDNYYTFYAFICNDVTASVYPTHEEALDELTVRINEDDSESYGIEPVHGIWELIKTIAEFEGYDDDWMEEVLYQALNMVNKKKDLLDQEKQQAELKK